MCSSGTLPHGAPQIAVLQARFELLEAGLPVTPASEGGSLDISLDGPAPEGASAAAAATAAAAAINGTLGAAAPGLPAASGGLRDAEKALPMPLMAATSRKPSVAALSVGAPTAQSCSRWHLAVDGVAVATLAVLTGVSLWLVAANAGENPTIAGIWLSVLFGPAGCLLRWRLAVYNAPGAIPRRKLKWLPIGTLAANLLACALNFGMQAAQLHGRPAGASAAAVAALVVGVGGSLSTVSTWAVEVQRLLLQWPRRAWGYSYTMLSSIAAVLLGLFIYGTAAWVL